jgi:transposase InsO family protein
MILSYPARASSTRRSNTSASIHRRVFRTRQEARLTIRHWIESWYNRRRLSSVLGYQSPIEWENNYRHTTNTLAA